MPEEVHPSPHIEPQGAARWLRRRVQRVVAGLQVAGTLLPDRFAGLPPTVEAFRRALGGKPALSRLRKAAAAQLQQLPCPIGFSCRSIAAPAQPRKNPTLFGPGPRRGRHSSLASSGGKRRPDPRLRHAEIPRRGKRRTQRGRAVPLRPDCGAAASAAGVEGAGGGDPQGERARACDSRQPAAPRGAQHAAGLDAPVPARRIRRPPPQAPLRPRPAAAHAAGDGRGADRDQAQASAPAGAPGDSGGARPRQGGSRRAVVPVHGLPPAAAGGSHAGERPWPAGGQGPPPLPVPFPERAVAKRRAARPQGGQRPPRPAQAPQDLPPGGAGRRHAGHPPTQPSPSPKPTRRSCRRSRRLCSSAGFRRGSTATTARTTARATCRRCAPGWGSD